MAKGRVKRPRRNSRKTSGRRSENPLASANYILEQGTLIELKNAKKRTAAHLRYYWNYFSELAYQRGRIEDEIGQSLNESCTRDFELKRWQRVVKYKYSLHPLSTEGSVRRIGGRFNMGKDVNPNLPSFPALYFAIDKDTALQETLGQVEVEGSDLSPRELALMSPKSETIVSVSGRLEHVLDIRTTTSLRKFTDLIKNFELSRSVISQARLLGQGVPEIVTTPSKLRESLLLERWRALPMLFDVPSNSQIFGHLVFTAGIEGIVYPSKLTGRDCVSIFPRNFAGTSSFVELDDPAPDGVVATRMDDTNWRLFEQPHTTF